MTGVGIRIKPKGIDETLAALGRIAGRLDRAEPMYDAIGGSLVASTQRRFEEGRAPDGNPWPPSIRALAEGGKTLVDTGRLMQSQTHIASETGVEVGTNLIYAAPHQFGATIRPVAAPKLRFRILGRWVSVDEVTIPRRPFLGIDEDDEREIIAIAEDFVGGAEAEARQ